MSRLRNVPEHEECSAAQSCTFDDPRCPVGRPLSELGFRAYWCPCNLYYLPTVGFFRMGRGVGDRIKAVVAAARGKLTTDMKLRIIERDGCRCTSCGSARRLEVHHVVAFVEWGSHDPDNLITLCFDCHRRVKP